MNEYYRFAPRFARQYQAILDNERVFYVFHVLYIISYIILCIILRVALSCARQCQAILDNVPPSLRQLLAYVLNRSLFSKVKWFMIIYIIIIYIL